LLPILYSTNIVFYMVEIVDCVVIGSGIVGLAIARRLARAKREVLILESASAIGTGISARNSEVIHAGLYYQVDSLKAQLCVAGRLALYQFCKEYGVAHSQVGKLLVATSEDELTDLREIYTRAQANGVTNLAWLDRVAVARLEPAVRCVAGLWSPSSGIIDSHGAMLAMLDDAEMHGASLALRTPVIGGSVRDNSIAIATGGAEPAKLICRSLVNCAGLNSWSVAETLDGLPSETIPLRYFAKGSYFILPGKSPFSHLVYPVPTLGGIGVHATLDLFGQARFGPDVEWVKQLNYEINPERALSFQTAIRRWWPDLPDGALKPGYAGIRPRLDGPNGQARDFLIQGSSTHGVAGLVMLYGIESPGLTASLAIADWVAGLLGVT
jgi:L-2-hydroxyglutarate oxidase LhgO